MFYLNALFWLIVLLWALNNHYEVRGNYISRRYDEHLSAEPFAGRCFLLLRMGLVKMKAYDSWDRISIDDLIDDVKDAVCCRQDRIFLALALPLLKLKRRYPNKEWIPFRTMFNIIGYFCYEIVNALFFTIAFVALESYIYVDKYIDYLDTTEHILFYAIPASVFLITLFIVNKVKQEELCWHHAFIAFIITFCLTYPMSYFYNWHNAKDNYVSAMEEEYGEDWQETVDEMEQDAIEDSYHGRD